MHIKIYYFDAKTDKSASNNTLNDKISYKPRNCNTVRHLRTNLFRCQCRRKQQGRKRRLICTSCNLAYPATQKDLEVASDL